MKSTLKKLDAGQLDMMWSMLKLGGMKANVHDVEKLIEYSDVIRQALIQKTAGQRDNGSGEYVDFNDLGTYINCIVCCVLVLRVSGWLDKLMDIMNKEMVKIA